MPSITPSRTAPRSPSSVHAASPGSSASLDSIDSLERAVRHRPGRSLVRRAHRRRSGLPHRGVPRVDRSGRRRGRLRAGSRRGFDEARDRALASDWAALERDSGATRDRMEAFARLLIDRPNAVIVWSMGLTQHAHGVDTIKALVNVGLARGLPGRANRGLVPIRGHSGVQGGAGWLRAEARRAAASARFADTWGFPWPSSMSGWTTSEMIDHAAEGGVDLFWIVGGNFLETLPDAGRSRRALRRPRLRVHQDIVLSSSMLVESDGDVMILPAATRYESAGGGTETSTERRIIFSPEIPGRRIGAARPEWQVLGEAMARAFPDRAEPDSFRDRRRDPRRDRARRAALRRHRDLARQGRSVPVGWAHALIMTAASPRPTARRTSPSSRHVRKNPQRPRRPLKYDHSAISAVSPVFFSCLHAQGASSSTR